MVKILANDGIDSAGKKIFETAGFFVSTEKVSQDNLGEALKNFDGVLVRSATQVRKEHIDAAPHLKLIGRAGVGMDNIDVKYARDKGLAVVNTPAASSQSVAELVFAFMFAGVRMLSDASRNMPGCETKERFNELKKFYSSGTELSGKTIGIVGAGQIGRSVAAMAVGMGMNVLFHRLNNQDVVVPLNYHPALGQKKSELVFKCVTFTKLLIESDFVTVHVPFPKGSQPIISKKEFDLMKNGAAIINTARGGVVSETELLEALNSQKIAFAGLDVFENEPLIREALRHHPRTICTPHIGGSTRQAQERIGIELAEKVVEYFNK
ncbi:MAG: D-2-hydroxyacid dehydrogenase [Bacteroidia bacterium]|nr:D-2-hydroxyacid dehydrogenase [Bacteroidia bacterium]MCZ2277635.1 D-2-hydroxyacid dehydrogenase [Bacteroidia bacterium]